MYWIPICDSELTLYGNAPTVLVINTRLEEYFYLADPNNPDTEVYGTEFSYALTDEEYRTLQGLILNGYNLTVTVDGVETTATQINQLPNLFSFAVRRYTGIVQLKQNSSGAYRLSCDIPSYPDEHAITMTFEEVR